MLSEISAWQALPLLLKPIPRIAAEISLVLPFEDIYS
jgi:hypothetical protein